MLDGPEKLTYISSFLSNEKREKLRLRLVNNIVFAWSHSDMIGINPTVASYKLIIIPTARLIRQKVRCFHPNLY